MGMKTLTLLRHAKSDWHDVELRDFDRPLNARGARAAATMGRHLHALGLAFDTVVASPAVRVTETIDRFENGYGEIAPAWDRRLYLASAQGLLDVVHGLPARAASALLVGHNPGLEELVLLLVADAGAMRDAVEAKFPTASVVEIAFDVDRWEDVAPASGELVRFIRPRDLDPNLGPDGS
jgi:phosphohistidine phosphatase